jgi:hypothetical protein
MRRFLKLGKPIPPRKKHPKIPAKSSVSEAKGKALPKIPGKPPRGWMLAGFDTSMSSLAGAAIAYDGITKKLKGPVFVMRRWSKEDHYFDRLKMAAMAHELISDLQTELVLTMGPEEIHIAQEEPFPLTGGFTQKGNSGWLKQQAEISGAFLGGLLRYGYTNLWQMSSMDWRQMIANDLGITTHHTKWRSTDLVQQFNCNFKDSGKFRSKQWAHPEFQIFKDFPDGIPDWPDIIETTKLGKIPRPEGSKARSVQPDDRYDALAILWTLYLDLKAQGIIS